MYKYENFKECSNIPLFTEYCTTVTCSFTIDNVVDSATYEGITLAITGDENLAAWEKEKSVTFESCYDSSPGTLVIKGSDYDVGGISMLTFNIKRRYPRRYPRVGSNWK